MLTGAFEKEIRFPRVAKAQPWAGIGERFQRYSFFDKSSQNWVILIFVQSPALLTQLLLPDSFFITLHFLPQILGQVLRRAFVAIQ